MSFDPYASGSEGPSEYDPAARPASDATYARQRVQAPAIALIVVGVLNLILAAVLSLYGFVYWKMPPEQMEELFRQQNPKALEDLKAQGWSISDIRNIVVNGSFSLGGVAFLASLLVILGGIRILVLRNYGLAIFASVLAAIPGISCSGCCGLGIVIGIWAIVVLINPEVRAGFR